jgi:hypothetical protein
VYVQALLHRDPASPTGPRRACRRAPVWRLLHVARALALLRGRDHALPEDVQALFEEVAAHRLVPQGDVGPIATRWRAPSCTASRWTEAVRRTHGHVRCDPGARWRRARPAAPPSAACPALTRHKQAEPLPVNRSVRRRIYVLPTRYGLFFAFLLSAMTLGGH